MAPGTNYMGGKRNAARSKTKDAATRAQKLHFNRQRLDVMTHALRLGGRTTSYGRAPQGVGMKATREDIELLHAHGRSQHPEDFIVRQQAPETPSRRHNYPRRGTNTERSSSGGRSSTSRVLQALDSTEPIAMRSVRSRILSLPDLAGLSTGGTLSIVSVATPLTKRRRSSSPLESVATDDSFRIEKASRQKKRMREEPSPFVHHFDPMEEYDDFEPDEYPQQRSTLIASRPSSATSSATCYVIEPDYSIDHCVAEALLNSPDVYQEPFNYRQLNTVSLSTHASGFTTPCIRTDAAASLFEYANPWHTIGAILGLEEARTEDLQISMDDCQGDDAMDILQCEDSEDVAYVLGPAITNSRPPTPSSPVDSPLHNPMHINVNDNNSPLSHLLSVYNSDDPSRSEDQPSLANLPRTPSPRSQIKIRFPASSTSVKQPSSETHWKNSRINLPTAGVQSRLNHIVGSDSSEETDMTILSSNNLNPSSNTTMSTTTSLSSSSPPLPSHSLPTDSGRLPHAHEPSQPLRLALDDNVATRTFGFIRPTTTFSVPAPPSSSPRAPNAIFSLSRRSPSCFVNQSHTGSQIYLTPTTQHKFVKFPVPCASEEDKRRSETLHGARIVNSNQVDGTLSPLLPQDHVRPSRTVPKRTTDLSSPLKPVDVEMPIRVLDTQDEITVAKCFGDLRMRLFDDDDRMAESDD
ncbi:hypothetical protein MIND_00216700 [Mycena indigotica]|uniref:Uncharacterized protein n=1 Tax=Mycena indigotica TaxID=2126181 RepID=A0A8H6WD25_9AGAR|nr:uncharacterized protein MIND_00216700 [Mycena indigotica]KAF7312046.1 hypothetical protein MIND_00216700 [Mycena indigotica]